jgi:hypothetical protein
MITAYLKFQKKQETKTRFNLIAYSKPAYENESFNPLIKPFIYAGHNPNIKASLERKSDLQINWNGRNLSSLFFIDIEKPALAYGDIYKTEDLILFVKENDIIEMFILKDKINHLQAVLDLWQDDELNSEIEYFRNKAVTI